LAASWHAGAEVARETFEEVEVGVLPRVREKVLARGPRAGPGIRARDAERARRARRSGTPDDDREGDGRGGRGRQPHATGHRVRPCLQALHFLERLGPEEWGYYGLARTGAGASPLTGGREASYVNRAVALFRHLAGLPTDRGPPAAP
jgi:hypothetical protein